MKIEERERERRLKIRDGEKDNLDRTDFVLFRLWPLSRTGGQFDLV